MSVVVAQPRRAAEVLAAAARRRRGDLDRLAARVNDAAIEAAELRREPRSRLRRPDQDAVDLSMESVATAVSSSPAPALSDFGLSPIAPAHFHGQAAVRSVSSGQGANCGIACRERDRGRDLHVDIDSESRPVVVPDEEASIIVAVRCRPMSTKELSLGCENAVTVLEGKVVVLTDPTIDSSNFYRKSKERREFQYAFDVAFDRDCGQRFVFERTTQCLIKPILDGYNATAFAYGATGAGKTHTMLGQELEPGIMALTLEALFRDISTRRNEKYKVTLSYLEVYNECIRDLLHPNPNPADFLDLREDVQKGITVAGITELVADSADHVMQLLQRGNRNRSTEPTAANKVSSRSHAVMQIVVEARDRLANLSHSVRTGKLSLIDLAGSERASATQNSGLRMIEGANINRSLLALANCINALGEAQKSGVKAFVPYRDSKLTRLLKDSLGGNARTVMIANISPAANVFEETHNTLKYANRAKNIKTKITRNVHAVESHIANYQSIINELRAEVQQLRQQLQVSNSLALGPSNQTVVSFSSTSPKNGNQRSVGPASPSHQRRGSAGAIPPSEQRELEAFRAQLQENFKNRLQIKRNLLDLEEMSLQQTIELNRRQVDIDIFEQLSKVDAGAVGEVSVPKRIRLLRMEASSIKDTLAKTAETKDAIVKQYAEWEAAAMELHQSMQSRITSSLARSALEMEISAQALQLENIEAEEGVLLQQLIIKQRDLSLKKMEIQLQLRDELIAEQKHLLRQLQPSLVHNSNPEDLENGTPRDDEKEFVDARNLKELHEREMKISASLPMLVRPRGNATHANASIAVSLPAISITPSARHPRAPSGKSVSSSVSLPQLNGQSKLRAPVQPRRAEFESDAVSSTPSGASSLIASHPYRPMVSQIAQRSASRVSSQSVEKPAPAISAFGFRHPVQSNAISVNATAVPTRSKIVAPKRK